jgi:hypothetical protein
MGEEGEAPRAYLPPKKRCTSTATNTPSLVLRTCRVQRKAYTRRRGK